MARKRCKPEEIVSLLRQAEVLHGQGLSMADAPTVLRGRTASLPGNSARAAHPPLWIRPPTSRFPRPFSDALGRAA